MNTYEVKVQALWKVMAAYRRGCGLTAMYTGISSGPNAVCSDASQANLTQSECIVVCVYVQCVLCKLQLAINSQLMIHSLSHLTTKSAKTRLTCCKLCATKTAFVSPFDLQRHVHQVILCAAD